MESEKSYDVVIVGGGIVGSSLLYVLSNYTSVRSIALIEKSGSIGSMSSDGNSNSQTLHFGDVETNYTEEEAKRVRDGARLMLGYAKYHRLDRAGAVKECQKMLLAIGEEEITYADQWYYSFAKRLFPGLSRIEGGRIVTAEPHLVKGRDMSEKLAGYMSDTGYMVDFGKVSFVENARNTGKKIDVMLSTRVSSLKAQGDEYLVRAGRSTIRSRSVVFSVGARSLRFAKSLGLAKDLGIIPTGGKFFKSDKILNGKVYRVQMGKMPFAAVHADPDINDPSITRFGPVIYLPLGIERGKVQPFEYLSAFGGPRSAYAAMRILGKYNLTGLLSRHMSYGLPFVGKGLFMDEEAKRMVPSLDYIEYARGYGGISPRIMDVRKCVLNSGEEKIRSKGAVFNISPSPGASDSLAIAKSDAKYIAKQLDLKFFDDKFEKQMG